MFKFLGVAALATGSQAIQAQSEFDQARDYIQPSLPGAPTGARGALPTGHAGGIPHDDQYLDGPLDDDIDIGGGISMPKNPTMPGAPTLDVSGPRMNEYQDGVKRRRRHRKYRRY